jgi:hypothetical protein
MKPRRRSDAVLEAWSDGDARPNAGRQTCTLERMRHPLSPLVIAWDLAIGVSKKQAMDPSGRRRQHVFCETKPNAKSFQQLQWQRLMTIWRSTCKCETNPNGRKAEVEGASRQGAKTPGYKKGLAALRPGASQTFPPRISVIRLLAWRPFLRNEAKCKIVTTTAIVMPYDDFAPKP